MPTKSNLYEILEVSPRASQEVIKAAYRSLVQRYHPDKNQGDLASEEILKEINRAYEILSNPKTREAYDAGLDTSTPEWESDSHGSYEEKPDQSSGDKFANGAKEFGSGFAEGLKEGLRDSPSFTAYLFKEINWWWVIGGTLFMLFAFTVNILPILFFVFLVYAAFKYSSWRRSEPATSEKAESPDAPKTKASQSASESPSGLRWGLIVIVFLISLIPSFVVSLVVDQMSYESAISDAARRSGFSEREIKNAQIFSDEPISNVFGYKTTTGKLSFFALFGVLFHFIYSFFIRNSKKAEREKGASREFANDKANSRDKYVEAGASNKSTVNVDPPDPSNSIGNSGSTQTAEEIKKFQVMFLIVAVMILIWLIGAQYFSGGSRKSDLGLTSPKPFQTENKTPVDTKNEKSGALIAETSPNTNQSAPLPSTPPVPNEQPLVAILQASASGDWDGVDARIQTIKQEAPMVSGDRKMSKAANSEGLRALRLNDTSAAISAFERGVSADSGDMEVLNNLAYAHLQAGHVQDAVRILTNVLLVVPDRVSAWVNLAEALAKSNNQNASRDALRLTVYFSSNRQRTVVFLNKFMESHPSEAFNQVIVDVLNKVDSIPPRIRQSAAIVESSPSVVSKPVSAEKAADALPTQQKTIDQIFSEQSAGCAPSLPGVFCREGFRLKLCAGEWSSNPPPGKSICQNATTSSP